MVLTRRDMLATSLTFAAALTAGCAKRPEPVLRLGTLVWPGFEPLFQARELGYLAENVQLVEYAGSPDILRSFQNHAIEAATATLDEVLQMAQTQADIRVIMAIDFSNGSDALVVNPAITSLAELRGKRIGVELNSLGAFVLNRVLELADVSLSEVEIVPITHPNAVAFYREGKVDAVICYEPFVSLVKAAGAVSLFDSSQMPGEIVDVLIVREETLQRQPETLRALVNAWFRAIDVFSKRPDSVMAQAAHHQGLARQELTNAFERIELLDRERNIALFRQPDGILSNTIRKLSASMKKYRLLDKMVDPEKLLDMSVLNKNFS